MKTIRFKHILWLLLIITSIAGIFITNGSYYTKLDKTAPGGLELPSFTLPLLAIVAIVLVEQARANYPDVVVNVLLGAVWVLLIGLVAVNA
ncbi:hypothetical protein J31TS4_11370 [Paenibacillus sp. J31TS4]|uniref:hypothetical protein n=1 Tax=Paenibacillus sp. J31TS4 TaxID=2807195 RepID=UPI001B02372D|nr:hypothetical protein [Paenibacillus sp. J31TS4]GIP37857.1 hypothetical protein J31TS4_11370 [Paenibacillus sp. J31TS4]